ncbi:MAG TPA: 30S ribosomal protein S12 methylthiotransferase RimO [Acidimicrobiales bacterium]|nr:30S ribosomal protein S12 methylthiotransferase RimO [Acidimicrobiales bacterium]
MAPRYWLETLGCPKNQVDSDKLAGLLESKGYGPARRADQADLVVVNTCAFIEAAREESIGTVLELAATKKNGAKLVVTGCMAERYGDELAAVLPEVDRVAGFGVPVDFGPTRLALSPSAPAIGRPVPSFDLLNLPRPPARAPWAYVKVAEGCDRHCGFCAIPSFRGPQRSRTASDILAEVDALGAAEVVLVAQDLVSWGRDVTAAASARMSVAGLVPLFQEVSKRVDRVRLLYLYPSGLSQELIEAVGTSGCPYFDLSLQHVSRPLLRRMRRFGDGDRFLGKISSIRRSFPDAALRSSFIVGYPGETEEDHDALLRFLEEAQLDWVGFFAFSKEDGTYAAGLPDQVASSLVVERTKECSELQDAITARKRAGLVGTTCQVLVDAPGTARSHREAPEIDGVIRVPRDLKVGSWVETRIVEAEGPDLVGIPVAA